MEVSSSAMRVTVALWYSSIFKGGNAERSISTKISSLNRMISS
jgi:hypothetical protein